MKIDFIDRDYKDLKDYCGYRIWEKPKATSVYAIGVDVAEGVGRDASCAHVLNCTTGFLAATYWSNLVDVDNYAAELFKFGTYYNKANMCIEANNHGSAVIALMGGAVGGLAYPNLYKRIVFDEYTQKRGKQIGFKTTQSTKPRIVENLKAALRDGELVLRCKHTIQELGSFIIDERTGRVGAGGSAKDDRVMALALAWEQARLIKENEKYTSEGSQDSVNITYDPSTGFPIFN